MDIFQIPIEVIILVAEYLEPVDLLSWSLTAKHYRYLMHNNAICRVALESYPFSGEFQDATHSGAYARALRRFVKRREAVQTANPFLVSVLAVADCFILCNEALCYTYNQEYLRILFLKGCPEDELELHIRHLLQTTLREVPEGRRARPNAFRPLYYAEGVLSCLCTYRRSAGDLNWLIVVKLQPLKVLRAHQIDLDGDVFVRNSRDHLFLGFTVESGESRESWGTSWPRIWHIQKFDLRNSEERPPRPFPLRDFGGDEIGSSACFEIFDSYLYGVSSQADFGRPEDRRNSFYRVFRFPLDDPNDIEILPRVASWRRRLSEGAVDDRWSSLQLVRDEKSGKLVVHESRREWLSHNSLSTRTCYSKEVVFPSDLDKITDLNPIALEPQPSLQDWDSQAYSEVRPPESLHFGDNAAIEDTYTFPETLIRGYNASCRTFVDLVDHARPSDSPIGQHLQLRMRPRLMTSDHAADKVQNSCIQQPSAHAIPDATSATAPGAGTGHEVRVWPPRGDDAGTSNQMLLDKYYRILNPQSRTSSIDWAINDRLLVYSPRPADKDRLRAIVLVSFDPAFRLRGVSSKAAVCNVDNDDNETANPALRKAFDRSRVPHGKAREEGEDKDRDQRACNQQKEHSKSQILSTQKAFYLSVPAPSGPAPWAYDLSWHDDRVPREGALRKKRS